MGIARHFSGRGASVFVNTSGDHLSSPSSSDSYNAFTFSAWAKQDYPFPERRAGLAGRLFDFHNGWAVFVGPDQRLYFFATGDPVDDPSQFQSVACPDLSNWTYIAVTYDRFAGSNNVIFYAGDTRDNLAVIGTGTRTGGFAELGVDSLLFGNVRQGELLTGGPAVNWNGSLTKIGLRTGVLSLEELRLEMSCDVHGTGIKYCVDVVGRDPEPSIEGGSSSAGPFTVNGTEVEEGPGIGCEYEPEDYPFYRRYLWMTTSAPSSGGGGSDPGGPPGGGGLIGEVDICSQL
jgi:hypothetical protein